MPPKGRLKGKEYWRPPSTQRRSRFATNEEASAFITKFGPVNNNSYFEDVHVILSFPLVPLVPPTSLVPLIQFVHSEKDDEDELMLSQL